MNLRYEICQDDFTRAGEVSADVKTRLKQMGADPEQIRRAVIALYEGEMNMVLHAGCGQVEVDIEPNRIHMVLEDQGPGIENVELAMQEGWSTATDAVRILGFGSGMGLPNMKKYTDIFAIESTPGKGTRVEMSVLLT